MTNGTRFEVIVPDDDASDAIQQPGRQLTWLRIWRSEAKQGLLATCNGTVALARCQLLRLNNDILERSRARQARRHLRS